jgi:predicted nucleotidyltransferase
MSRRHPIRFSDLIDAVPVPIDVREVMANLLHAKRQASEVVEAPRLPVLDAWIDGTIDALRSRRPDAASAADPTSLDAFFRSAIGG